MEPIVVPRITVSFLVDLVVDYDSFSGRTTDDVAESLQDELDTLLFETSSTVRAVSVKLKSVKQ